MILGDKTESTVILGDIDAFDISCGWYRTLEIVRIKAYN